MYVMSFKSSNRFFDFLSHETVGSSAQGTIEYLVILSIVVVIALGVIVMSSDFLGSTGGTASTSQSIGQRT